MYINVSSIKIKSVLCYSMSIFCHENIAVLQNIAFNKCVILLYMHY